MAILFRKHERLSNLAQNSVKRYILQLYIWVGNFSYI